MAAGTKVCRNKEHRASTVPTSKQSGSSRITGSSLLKSFTQHHLWRVLPYPPIRNCFTAQMCPVTMTSQVLGGSAGGVPPTAPAQNYSPTLKVNVFGCLFEPRLKSISTVQMYLNRVFFPVTVFHKPLCFPLLGMCLGKSRECVREEMSQEVIAVETTTENPNKEFPGDVQVVCGGDAMAGECGEIGIHLPATPPPEEHMCYESEDSDCEYDGEEEEGEDIDEFGYESDNDADDDCVEFSDEADMPEQTCPEDVPIPKSQHYTTLFSVESGYCDLANESFSSSENEWSENESEDSNFEMSGCKGDKASEMLWKHFEMQALSPVICRQKGSGTEVLTSCCDVKTPTMNCVIAIKQTRMDAQHDMPTATGDKVSKSQLHRQNPLETVSRANHSESENTSASNTSLSSNQSARHVSFKSDPDLVEIHHIIAWDFAYRAARKGPWEQYARDRMHFRRRIDSLAPVLEPCLARKLESCVAVL